MLGSAPKHDAFVARHAQFFERLGSLHDAENAAFNRTLHDPSELDRVIFYFGIRICQDFAALTLLAAHDFGLAATALLRGMYERIVTAAHLRAHPQEVEAFLDYDAVQARKALNRLREAYTFNEDDEVAFDAIEERYQQVKERFATTECPHCRRSPMPNWTTTDFVTMARSLDPLGAIIASAYDVPLAQAHATARSINSLLKIENGDVVYRTDFADEADNAFHLGHMITMHALQLQVDHFEDSRIEEAVDKAAEDYVAIWPGTEENAGA